ncbi:hypothetical protein CROQUDRAFT_93222 [Cronartium quercuum f. sp. fusiforme G11]|uniref:Uncharacterized protein n=1 Tax=Cronartium quercuum f. sp. fusiforme G11 TaxID=708437 RepID=A0A9P6TBU1_9BASI|nr:hypothetical protein CROQUDRAFT_93222 [Cronartium quercuum f. sp. fusiforme G11]
MSAAELRDPERDCDILVTPLSTTVWGVVAQHHGQGADATHRHLLSLTILDYNFYHRYQHISGCWTPLPSALNSNMANVKPPALSESGMHQSQTSGIIDDVNGHVGNHCFRT